MAKSKSRLAGKIVLFALIFGIPWGLLFFLANAEHTFVSLRYLGPKQVTESGDTVNYTIPEFEFTLHNGGTLTKQDLLGNYTIATVISNQCPDTCAIQLYQFWELVYQEIISIDSYKDVNIVSEVVNYQLAGPDEPDEVSNYLLDELDVDPGRWKFFTTRHNVLFDFEPRPGRPNPIDVPGEAQYGGKKYYQLALLIDKECHIRGMYRLNHSAWIMELRNGLRMLIKEDILSTKEEES